MATTDPRYGKNATLRIAASGSAVQITNLTSNGISKDRDTRDVTTKDSGDWREIRPTYKGAEISFEAIFSETATQGYDEINGWWANGTEIVWEYGTGVSGERRESGSGYILTLDLDDPQDGNSAFSGTILVTGEITVDTYSV